MFRVPRHVCDVLHESVRDLDVSTSTTENSQRTTAVTSCVNCNIIVCLSYPSMPCFATVSDVGTDTSAFASVCPPVVGFANLADLSLDTLLRLFVLLLLDHTRIAVHLGTVWDQTTVFKDLGTGTTRLLAGHHFVCAGHHLLWFVRLLAHAFVLRGGLTSVTNPQGEYISRSRLEVAMQDITV